MKKIYTLGLVGIMAMSMVAGCTPKDKTPVEGPETPGVETPVENESVITKVGLGVLTSIGKSKDKGEEGATGQVDTTMAAVAFDKDGKIVKVSIDVAQSKVAFDKEMQLKTNLEEAGKTKKELGADYGMVGASTIKKEWFEQMAELEKWLVGKTVEEVKAMKVMERDESHKSVPDEEDLKTSVTITVESYIAAVEKAWLNAVDVEKGNTVGLGQVISMAKSKSQTAEKGALAQVDTTIAAMVFDKEGKVVKTIVDTAQTKVQYSLEGVVETSKEEAPKTKKELGDAYGMKGASEIKKEWFEQIQSLEEWTVGKTPDEIAAMKISEDVPAEEDLKSTVTIKVSGYLEAMKESAESALK